MNIGIIGAGAIAQFLLEHLNGANSTGGVVKALLVRNKEAYRFLEEQYDVTLYTELEQFLAASIDIVVEAAELQVVEKIIPIVLKTKPVIVISVGALVDEQLLSRLQMIANEFNTKIYLPSGAIGGLDLLQNANVLGEVSEVSLTTTKPAGSLLKEEIQEAQIVFEGTAQQAIKQYPKNMNVSIILALASIGYEHTKVTLVADPFSAHNVHEISIKGTFGEAMVRVKNNPLPSNPKTSYLAAMSILQIIKVIKNEMIIG